MDGLISRALRNLGIDHLEVIMTLTEEWGNVAPEPWCSHSTPLLLKDGELLVEADSPQAVRLLRYAIGGLLQALDERFGGGVVGSVRVQPPGPAPRSR
jgi:hypothetical protein